MHCYYSIGKFNNDFISSPKNFKHAFNDIKVFPYDSFVITKTNRDN